MKEIAVTASTGKHDNELIGATQMPLKVRKSYSVMTLISIKSCPLVFIGAK